MTFKLPHITFFRDCGKRENTKNSTVAAGAKPVIENLCSTIWNGKSYSSLQKQGLLPAFVRKLVPWWLSVQELLMEYCSNSFPYCHGLSKDWIPTLLLNPVLTRHRWLLQALCFWPFLFEVGLVSASIHWWDVQQLHPNFLSGTFPSLNGPWVY